MKGQIGNLIKERLSIEDAIFWAMLGFAFPFSVKTNLTGTGIIYIYISMFIYLFIGLFFLKTALRKWKQETKVVVNYLILCIWYIVASGYRYFTGGAWYASFLICFWAIIPVTIYILMQFHSFDYKKVCARLYWAMTLLNFFSCIYCLVIVKLIRTDFLGNINMLVYFSVLGMYIYTFYFLHSKGRMNGLLYIFNMSYSTFVVMFSGSRAGVLTGTFAVIMLVALHIRNKKVMKALGIVGLVTAALLILSLATNFYWSRNLLFRGLNLSTISKSLDASKDEKKLEEDIEINQLMEEASLSGNEEQVLVLNDIGRIMMWKNAVKEIQKAPLIGTGTVAVYRTKDGNQTPHNFILEYWLTYGGIGLLLWVVLAIQVLYEILKKCSGDRKKLLFILAYIAVALMYSMVEPTMSNSFGAFLLWCGVGVFGMAEGQCTNVT